MANEDEDDAVYNRYYTTIEVEKVIPSGLLQNLLSSFRYVRAGICI